MEKIPNIEEMRRIMYPSEIYTLQDMMEDEVDSDGGLEDTIWQLFRNTDILTDVDEKRRLIELTVHGDEVLKIGDLKDYAQQVSNVVQKLGAGRVEFIGISGSSEFRINLIYKY